MKPYNWYNIDGQVIESANYEFNGNRLTLEYKGISRTWKVVECNEFTYKVQKTQIKAIDGVEGLKRFIEKANKPDATFNTMFFRAIKGGVAVC